MRRLETLSDIELIHAFQQGNEIAFTVLYNRYQQKILHTIVYYVKDRTLAEDLSQEAHVKIIRSITANRYCEEGKFLPWVLRIVHNLCMDHLRKKKRTAYVPDFTHALLSKAATSSPEVKFIREQTAACLHSLLEKLTAEQKTVVHYRHFEDRSFKDIAKLTNSSVNTSLGRMRYAMVRLRNLTQNHPAFC